MKRFTFIAAMLLSILPALLSAQSLTVSGKVKAAQGNESLSAVSVLVKGTDLGTFTDPKGNFKLSLPASTKFPITLLFSSVGFEFTEKIVDQAGETPIILLTASSTLGQEVVVSATRTPLRIIESPVSIDRLSNAALRNAPSADYFDVVANLKGVDIVASSLTFKTVTTRGFSGSGNTRFTQLVDGMDNQAPGLNFSVGSIIGLSELDVESIELLQGASSALYGPGGMNGTMLINSKDPFKHQGLSFQAKNGVMHVDGKYRDPSPYYNYDLRFAKKVSEKFAFKITAGMIQAKDWLAGDQRNVSRSGTQLGAIVPGTRDTDPNYDGMNMYGDETSGSINAVLRGVQGQAPFLAPFINNLLSQPDSMVSRTGYHEKDVTNPNTVNFKVGGSLNYKLSNSVEAILSGFWGTGNTVYTATERYSLLNLKMGQYKLEFKHKNWLLRAYTTQEDAGNTYNTTITTRLFNEAWKSSTDPNNGWFKEYGLAYLSGRLGGLTSIDAHNQARTAADVGRPVAGSQQFNTLFDAVKSKAISDGGGRLIDRTNLYAVEGQYNLSHLTGNVVDVLLGGNFRQFLLNSEGTLFADSAGKISINEFGSYLQVSKGIANDAIKFTVSGRYDKNENFKGRFTPRATMLLKLAKNNNLRVSYQTAYRFPSNQYQYINLRAAGAILIGGIPKMLDYYGLKQNPAYSLTALQSGQFVTQQFGEFKPESVTSYEIGYKGLLADSRLLVDAYGYIGNYQDFLTRVNVVQSITNNPSPLDLIDPSKRRILSIPVNSPSKVKTNGWGISLEYKFNKGYYLNTNLSSDVLVNAPVGYITFFNSPKYRSNVGFGNNGVGKNKRVGFNVVYRWQAEVDYQSDLANGIVPAYHLLDAQVGYKFPKINTIVRLGANNLLNQYYITGLANPSIGGLYYVSFGYNIF
jgi:outer membrane receptor protein involved in Fe transport